MPSRSYNSDSDSNDGYNSDEYADNLKTFTAANQALFTSPRPPTFLAAAQVSQQVGRSAAPPTVVQSHTMDALVAKLVAENESLRMRLSALEERIVLQSHSQNVAVPSHTVASRSFVAPGPESASAALQVASAIQHGYPPDFYTIPNPPAYRHEDYPGIPLTKWDPKQWKQPKKHSGISRLACIVLADGTEIDSDTRSELSTTSYKIWDEIYEQTLHADGHYTGLVPPRWFKAVPFSIINYYVRKMVFQYPYLALGKNSQWKALEIAKNRYGTWINKQPNVDESCKSRAAQKRAATEVAKDKRLAKKAKQDQNDLLAIDLPATPTPGPSSSTRPPQPQLMQAKTAPVAEDARTPPFFQVNTVSDDQIDPLLRAPPSKSPPPLVPPTTTTTSTIPPPASGSPSIATRVASDDNSIDTLVVTQSKVQSTLPAPALAPTEATTATGPGSRLRLRPSAFATMDMSKISVAPMGNTSHLPPPISTPKEKKASVAGTSKTAKTSKRDQILVVPATSNAKNSFSREYLQESSAPQSVSVGDVEDAWEALSQDRKLHYKNVAAQEVAEKRRAKKGKGKQAAAGPSTGVTNDDVSGDAAVEDD